MTTYREFLESKKMRHGASGVQVDTVHSALFPFQSAITRWALNKGRACIFAGTGLGKTRMQCEWNPLFDVDEVMV